jgi:hypothetical protein
MISDKNQIQEQNIYINSENKFLFPHRLLTNLLNDCDYILAYIIIIILSKYF